MGAEGKGGQGARGDRSIFYLARAFHIELDVVEDAGFLEDLALVDPEEGRDVI